jgi:hypothetical protein
LILSFWALPDTRENSENYRNSIISNQWIDWHEPISS